MISIVSISRPKIDRTIRLLLYRGKTMYINGIFMHFLPFYYIIIELYVSILVLDCLDLNTDQYVNSY